MVRPLNPVFAGRPVTIFAVMSALARRHNAINLGQGFPDEDGPQSLKEAAARAILDEPNQYAPVGGVSDLRAAIAGANRRFYGIETDPETETLVTAGATEALAAAFLAFLQPTDEAILIAPVYDCYAPIVEAAGAVPKIVALAPPAWRIERAAIEAAVTDKTRVIAINTPHNPTGRVLTREELQIVADIALKHDLLVICDEVYEHLVFDGRAHLPLMAFPGMRERTVRIGSAGKTFSMTGWRIGYLSGPARLIDGVMKAHQFIAYTCPPHLQKAVAMGLGFPDRYFSDFIASLQEKRDLMAALLADAGLAPLPCEGTYFVSADIRSVGGKDDWAFCRDLTEKAGVAAVPVSAFYPQGDPRAPRHLARFCFCKKTEVLEAAGARLKVHFGGRSV
ncbi:MAG: aminotransferase [Parvularculaceae bacterium]|nr:aminotransferase [Parvularculaceae bacterium]